MSVKKIYTAEEKARIALEALRGNMTYNEISTKYQVHSTQINRWKTIARASLINGFKENNIKPKMQDNELVDELYRQIGQLKMELEWLKKKATLFCDK
jgi:transposase-like protein